ncbi:OmpH family outer membrane protein [Thioalkalicoccus limnaeus]|uniref:OmpH family outer membrane protein n=1 Tax=Thioalkalicoccus limnaeus TaxID=120681 RepID=A0ABV4BGJ5_9GAMM
MLFRSACLTLGLLIAAPVLAEQPTSIGYVDMQQVLERSQLGTRARERLEQEFGPQRMAFAQEEQAIRQLQQALERDKPLMSNEQIGKREEEIKTRIARFQEQASATQTRLMEEQQKMTQEIIGPALEAVDQVARERQVAAVFERGQAGLVYVDEALDLTPTVIQRLNANTK